MEDLVKAMSVMIQNQQKEMALFRETLTALVGGGSSKPTEVSTKALADVIELFQYAPDNDLTFDRWFSRYEDTFLNGCPTLDDKGRVRLLLQRFDADAHRKYADFILPVLPKDRSFEATVNTCKTLFAKQESLFCSRWKCFQIAKSSGEDFASYAGNVNKLCERFELKKLTSDEFKCLIFILGLRDHSILDIRTRLHNLMDVKPESERKAVNLETLVAEANRLINLKADCKLGSASPSVPAPAVAVIKQSKKQFQNNQFSSGSGPRQQQQQQQRSSSTPKPKYPCQRCGAMHFTRDCEYVTRTCRSCGDMGHKEGYCEVAARIGQNDKYNRVSTVRVAPITLQSAVPTGSSKSADQLLFVNNVAAAEISRRKFVRCTIMGVNVDLQLDTAADVSILSKHAWVSIGMPALECVSEVPVDANGKPLRILGVLSVPVTVAGTTKNGRIFVAESDISLFGIEWMELFRFWDQEPSHYCLQD